LADRGWMVGTGPVQAKKKQNTKNKSKEALRMVIFSFQRMPRRGWKRKTSRKMAVAVSTMADPGDDFK